MDKENQSFKVAGIMSGTSLDGLDICIANFWQSEKHWKYKIVCTKAIKYSNYWKEKLARAPHLNGRDLALVDREFGRYIGSSLLELLKEKDLQIDLVASHGHTIFHEPQKQLSLQIGHGAFITAYSNTSTVSDLRSLDTAYGGQGAPLVPLAENFLFPNYKQFLNIGGIANISIHKADDSSIGFDICPANQVLNYLAEKGFNQPFDNKGEIAKSGKVDQLLLSKLNKIRYYQEVAPKSLGREFTEAEVIPILENNDSSIADQLCTFNHHIADQVASSLHSFDKQTIVASGGGAFNSFLFQLLIKKGVDLITLDDEFTEMKEALCFGFLGLRRYLQLHNVSASVTGADKDNIGGSIFLS